MKVRRLEPKQEFVPVIITLENQEEVDSLHAIMRIGQVLSISHSWSPRLGPYTSDKCHLLWDKLCNAIR